MYPFLSSYPVPASCFAQSCCTQRVEAVATSYNFSLAVSEAAPLEARILGPSASTSACGFSGSFATELLGAASSSTECREGEGERETKLGNIGCQMHLVAFHLNMIDTHGTGFELQAGPEACAHHQQQHTPKTRQQQQASKQARTHARTHAHLSGAYQLSGMDTARSGAFWH